MARRAAWWPEAQQRNRDRRAQAQALVAPFRQTMEGVPVPEMRPGDVLLFADAAYPGRGGMCSIAG